MWSIRKKQNKESSNTLTSTQKLTLFFFDRTKVTALLWATLLLFGALSYTTFLKREGFPSIQTPYAIGQGAYLVNDAQKVDTEVAKPLSDFLLKQDGVKTVQTQSFDNFYTVAIAFNEGVNAETRSTALKDQVVDKKIIPEQAQAKIEAYKFGFTPRGDSMVLATYGHGDESTGDLTAKAKEVASYLQSQNLSLVENISVIDPYQTAVNPQTGETQTTQKSFDRFGKREDSKNEFHNSISIGIIAKKGADNLELDKQVQGALNQLNSKPEFSEFHTVVSASFAPQINDQVNELQKSLLEGLLAILIVGSIIIAIRASLVTVIAMVTVIAIVNGILLLTGYTLNTITLFALILGLSLIVDDTIIMVEAIDAQRKKYKDPRKVVKVATKKISRAMIAATSTAALSFAPLLFVGGILGSFIRAIPTTIIAALVTSLVVALVFIPFFAKFVLLRKKSMGKENVKELSAGIEATIAKVISAPMLWAKHSTKKLFAVGFVAVFIGLGFIGASGYLMQKVTFNIFPPSKDSNQLMVTLKFAPDTTIEQAEAITDKANTQFGDIIGTNFVQAAYYGQATVDSAVAMVDITKYSARDIRAPEIVEKINQSFTGFQGAQVVATQTDAGPPASAFSARIESSKNREAAIKLANDISVDLKGAELKRPDGSIAKIKAVSVTNPSIFTRDGGKSYVEVTASFVDTDTTTLVTLAKSSVEKQFPESKVASYGLEKNALSFNFGQEDENQDSFKTLALAFPILLCVIYVLLAFQFKSMLQPLLIFMALPFSLFGITLGLFITDNPFSFFAMLGFFALIGLSIKNTILLADYANQARRSGLGPVDAAHEALAERFRPLIATSLTAVFSLIPLAISSPFWEGLAVVLIGGLLSSTFLVITVFPYYYLGSEFLRQRVSRKGGIAFVMLTLALAVGFSKIAGPVAILAPFVAVLVLKAPKLIRKSRA